MLTPEKLKAIGEHILNGMTEREACVLEDIKIEDLIKLKNENEKVRNYIEKKFVTFKYKHLKEIQGKKSEKTSQWLLEKLRSDEFGTKSKGGEPQTINIISQMIKQIQYENEPIINVSRGTRLGTGEENKSDEESTSRPRIAEILN